MSLLEVLLERETYEPGEVVRGRVVWQNIGSQEELLITLLWYTEGKGTEDATIHAQEIVAHPPLRGDQAFELTLPDFPWSFSGELISLIWTVEAVMKPNNEVARADLIAAPGGEEIFLQKIEDP